MFASGLHTHPLALCPWDQPIFTSWDLVTNPPLTLEAKSPPSLFLNSPISLRSLGRGAWRMAHPPQAAHPSRRPIPPRWSPTLQQRLSTTPRLLTGSGEHPGHGTRLLGGRFVSYSFQMIPWQQEITHHPVVPLNHPCCFQPAVPRPYTPSGSAWVCSGWCWLPPARQAACGPLVQCGYSRPRPAAVRRGQELVTLQDMSPPCHAPPGQEVVVFQALRGLATSPDRV